MAEAIFMGPRWVPITARCRQPRPTGANWSTVIAFRRRCCRFLASQHRAGAGSLAGARFTGTGLRSYAFAKGGAMTAANWAVLVLGGIAVFEDLRRRQIPNWLTGVGVIAGFVFGAAKSGWAGLAWPRAAPLPDFCSS